MIRVTFPRGPDDNDLPHEDFDVGGFSFPPNGSLQLHKDGSVVAAWAPGEWVGARVLTEADAPKQEVAHDLPEGWHSEPDGLLVVPNADAVNHANAGAIFAPFRKVITERGKVLKDATPGGMDA